MKYSFVIPVYNEKINIKSAANEIQKLIARKVEGIIIASAFLKDKSVQFCIKQNIPLVLVNRSIQNEHLTHRVLNDDAYGMQLSIDHLQQLGHRHLIHFAGPQTISQGKERLEAFLAYCQKKGVEGEVLQLDAFNVEAGVKGTDAFLKRGLSALRLLKNSFQGTRIGRKGGSMEREPGLGCRGI